MNFNKVIFITLSLFILGCSSTENSHNPANGIIFYEDVADTGLEAAGGKLSIKYMVGAEKHCSKYYRKAVYVKSGLKDQGFDVKKIRAYEEFKCVRN